MSNFASPPTDMNALARASNVLIGTSRCEKANEVVLAQPGELEAPFKKALRNIQICLAHSHYRPLESLQRTGHWLVPHHLRSQATIQSATVPLSKKVWRNMMISSWLLKDCPLKAIAYCFAPPQQRMPSCQDNACHVQCLKAKLRIFRRSFGS